MTICEQMELGIAQERMEHKNWLASFFEKISASYKTRRQQRINRAAFNNLLHVDEAILRDMGLSRGDVEWASQLPLKCNAGQILEAEKAKRIKASREAMLAKSDWVKKRIKKHGYFYL